MACYKYSDWATNPLDSGYSSSSTKKENSGGLLSGLINFFKNRKTTPRGEGKKKKRKGVGLASSDSQPDITDNYFNFQRNDGPRSSFSVSPYEVSPNAFINNQGLMRGGNELKPKKFNQALPRKPKEPEVPEFDIPIAGGQTRPSVVGLFDNPPPSAANAKVEEMIGKNPSTGQPSDRSGTNTPKGSVHSHNLAVTHSRTSVHSHAHSPSNKPHPITVIAAAASQKITVTSASNESVDNGDQKKLSPQCSELSVRSEDPHILYQQIYQQDSGGGCALQRRGSLPNSLISDSSFKSERSEERRRRRRGGPKQIGPPPKPKLDVPVSLAPPPNQHAMFPFMMGDPRYMPPHGPPYMPHPPPNMMPGSGRQKYSPHHLLPHYNLKHSQENTPHHYPPPMMYPMYGYGVPPPQMFPPVLEEEVGEGSNVEEVGEKAKVKVKRRETMERKEHKQRRNNPNQSKSEGDKTQVEPDADLEDPDTPKGFDDFTLY